MHREIYIVKFACDAKINIDASHLDDVGTFLFDFIVDPEVHFARRRSKMKGYIVTTIVHKF